MTSQGQTFLKQVPIDALNGDAWRAMIHFAEQSSMWGNDDEKLDVEYLLSNFKRLPYESDDDMTERFYRGFELVLPAKGNTIQVLLESKRVAEFTCRVSADELALMDAILTEMLSDNERYVVLSRKEGSIELLVYRNADADAEQDDLLHVYTFKNVELYSSLQDIFGYLFTCN